MGFFSNFKNTCPNNCKDDLGEEILLIEVGWNEDGHKKFVCPVCGWQTWR